MSEQHITTLELSIEEAQKAVKLGEHLDRLMKNRDFKALIEQNYFKDEAVRLVHLKGSPKMASEELQTFIDNCMIGISGLQQYFNTVRHNAMQAEVGIEECEREIDAIRSGELDVDAED